MTEGVKSRRYSSPLRDEQARRTRPAILDAARRLFCERGYAATPVADIAAAAGVAVDTVYAAAGPKPVLFRLLLETSISGTDEIIPAEAREYVQQIRAHPRARQKLETYAAAVGAISERLGPLHRVLREAAGQVPELAQLRDAIDRRRANNMRLFAEDLVATGDLRPGLDVDEIADVVWSMNAPEFHHLLVHERGWSREQFQRWLGESWCRLFLADAGDA